VTFLLDNWLLVLMALTSGALLFAPGLSKAGTAHRIGTTEAVRLINREKGVLVDVSEPAEYAAGHAAGARHVPFGQLEAAAKAAEGGGNTKAERSERGKGLPTNKALPVLLLCPTGARAGRAATLLRKAGYDKAYAVTGGTAAWREASLPIEKSDKSEVAPAA
jgi:rhodanese-related sulfurtransferase